MVISFAQQFWVLPLLARLSLLGVHAYSQGRLGSALSFSSLEIIKESWAQLRLVLLGHHSHSSPFSPVWASLSKVAVHPLWPALLNLAADATSAWVLGGLAGPWAGQAYLWNPLSLLAWLAGSTAPLLNLLILTAGWAAAARRPLLTGVALACAARLSAYAALYMLPYLLLLWHGLRPGNAVSKGPACLRRSKLGSCEAEPVGDQGGRRDALQRCAAFLFALLTASLALLWAENAAAAALAWQACTVVQRGHAAGGAACRAAAGQAAPGRLAWVWGGDSRADGAVEGTLWGLWFVRRLLFIAQVDNLGPNLGLSWYLFAQVFPKFRALFQYCFHAMPAVMAVPIALRFPHRPLLCLLCQALSNCLFSVHPTWGDVGLWLSLVPAAAAPQLTCLAGKGWWALSFLAILALNTAAYELWWVQGMANANFLYGMNLAWAAWQLLFLIQLLKTTARLEVLEGGELPQQQAASGEHAQGHAEGHVDREAGKQAQQGAGGD